MNHSDHKSTDNQELHFFDLVTILIDSRKLTLKIFSFIFVGFFLYAIVAPITYKSETLLIPAESDNQFNMPSNPLAGLVSIPGFGDVGGQGSVQTSIAILKSKSFISKFINDLNILPIIYHDNFDKDKNEWKTNPPSLTEASERFTSDIMSINEDKVTGIIALSVIWKDPETSTFWANELVKRVNDHIRIQDIEETSNNIEYLENELKKTSLVSIQNVISSLIETEVKTIMTANVREQYAFKIIDPAVKPESRHEPKRSEIVITGFIVALVLSIIVSLLLFFAKSYLRHVK